MVDQLLSSSSAKQVADTAANLNRLEALLAPGQPRTAQVVQVNPQPLPGSAQGATVATQIPASEGSATTQPASAKPATPTGGTTSATPGSLAQPPATTSGELFRIQVRLQGRLFELITSKPLEPGSQVQLSRGNSRQIILQPLPAGGSIDTKPAPPSPPLQASIAQQPANSPASGRASSPPLAASAVTTSTLATSSATTATTTAATQQGTVTSANTASERMPPAASPNSAAGSNPQAATAARTSNINTPATPSTQSAPSQARVEATTERVQLQPLTQLPPIKQGQRLSAQVLSSNVLTTSPAGSPIQPGGKAAAPATTSNATTAAEPTTTRQESPASYKVRLHLQGQRIDLISPRPIQAGSSIQLIQTPQGQLQAELPSAKTQAIEQLLREHLPQQQSPSTLLNLISAAQSTGQLQQAKPVLLNLIQLLTGRTLSSPQQADAETVRQQVNNSGTLLENKLARGDTLHLNQDQKVLLLKLSQQLGQPNSQRELPQSLSERLIQLTQQTLSRVLVNQVTSLGAQSQESNIEPNRSLVLDIPILWQNKAENLQLKIRREAQHNDANSDEMRYRWQVRLHFEIEESRVLQADLSLEGERISVIWSGDSQLRQQVQRRLDSLQQQLEGIGLEINVLGVREQPADTNSSPTLPRNQLIDIQT